MAEPVTARRRDAEDLRPRPPVRDGFLLDRVDVARDDATVDVEPELPLVHAPNAAEPDLALADLAVPRARGAHDLVRALDRPPELGDLAHRLARRLPDVEDLRLRDHPPYTAAFGLKSFGDGSLAFVLEASLTAPVPALVTRPHGRCNDTQAHFIDQAVSEFHFRASPLEGLTCTSALGELMDVHRALAFQVRWDAPSLDWLLSEFRLLVNLRSRARLARAAYQVLSRGHALYKQYIPSAFEVALTVLNAHRRRLKRKKRSSVPYMRKLMLKAENQSYWLDRKTGRLRIPIRGTEGVQLHLPLSKWHRSFLSDPAWSLGSLTVVPGKIILVLRREAPKPYEPKGAIALDTNEESLDGVVASYEGMVPTSLPLGGVRRIQATHFRRRRRLAMKKAGDRRVMRRLLNREGRRERHRVRARLHRVSKGVVQFAKNGRAAIVLEDLTLHGAGGRSRRMNRRLSSWPRSEIHRQIEYKAALAGVPVIKVNPQWTSKTCPVCGARRRDRVGQDFVCLHCDWEMDRQINAGMNILKTALASNEALARAVRFQPGALRHDVVSPLYDLSRGGMGARDEPSGVELQVGVIPSLDL